MKPFYYFCDDVREDYQYRTIDNESYGLNRLPNNWIHGIDSVGNRSVRLLKWISPPYKEHYKNDEFTFEGKLTVFVTSKYNLEHGNPPLGFFDIKCLYEMFEYLTGGYSVILQEDTNKKFRFTIDQNEQGGCDQGYQEISR